MSILTLLPDRYSVTYAGETIAFLPKEYELFEFLYNNKNQGFSREQLLDAVWNLEEPTDRTVDDHIYRLRKKLTKWGHILLIETIRGTGYRLTIKQTDNENPLLKDPDFVTQVSTMFGKYQRFGNGEAIQTLAANKDILGIQLDQGAEALLHFMSADFEWFIHSKDFPYSYRAYFLLHIYSYCQDNFEEVLSLFEEYGRKNILKESMQREIEQINIIGFYIFTGHFRKALRKINHFYETYAEDQRDPFIFHIMMMEICLFFSLRRMEKVEELFAKADNLLQHLPFNREKGIIYTLKGLYFLYKEDNYSAMLWLDKGLDILKQSRFIPHYIVGVRFIHQYFNHFKVNETIRSRYDKLWTELSGKYQFQRLEPLIKNELLFHL